MYCIMIEDVDSDAGMFGSCATGLALPDSDIDITISGFEMFPKA